MEQIECSEMSAYKIEMPGNYPKENILHSEHGESLKSGNILFNSFRMDTVMHSGTYWLKSRYIICVPDEVYKKFLILNSNCFQN